MTIGAGTFLPSARFAFPQSYVYEIIIARYGTTITRAGTAFAIHAVPPDPTIAIIELNARFSTWNSNRMTLDYCVDEFYVLIGGGGSPIPLDYTLSYAISPFTKRPCLQFEWFSGTPNFQRFTLPSQPSNYWAPKPL